MKHKPRFVEVVASTLVGITKHIEVRQVAKSVATRVVYGSPLVEIETFDFLQEVVLHYGH